jgi:hypothetical protein
VAATMVSAKRKSSGVPKCRRARPRIRGLVGCRARQWQLAVCSDSIGNHRRASSLRPIAFAGMKGGAGASYPRRRIFSEVQAAGWPLKAGQGPDRRRGVSGWSSPRLLRGLARRLGDLGIVSPFSQAAPLYHDLRETGFP